MRVDLNEGREAMVFEFETTAVVVTFEYDGNVRVGTHAELDDWGTVQRVKDRLRHRAGVAQAM